MGSAFPLHLTQRLSYPPMEDWDRTKSGSRIQQLCMSGTKGFRQLTKPYLTTRDRIWYHPTRDGTEPTHASVMTSNSSALSPVSCLGNW